MKMGIVRVIKIGFGLMLVFSGIGINTMANTLVPMLCSNRPIFGLILVTSGILLFPWGKIKD